MKKINLNGTWELQGSAHEAMMDPAGEWLSEPCRAMCMST